MYPSSKEDKILLAIQAIQNSKKNQMKPISITQAAKIFNVPKTTLRRRMNKQRSREESRIDTHKLNITITFERV
jgi:DNA invertase Pin-like site-specific DNA recombinase